MRGLEVRVRLSAEWRRRCSSTLMALPMLISSHSSRRTESALECMLIALLAVCVAVLLQGVNELFVELHGSEVVEPEEMDHYFEDLKTKVLELSVSKVWDSAIFEWKQVREYFVEDGGQCSCKQKIYRHIVMRNEKRSTDTEPVEIIVGSVCVDRFEAVDTMRTLLARSVFKSLERVKSKPAKACANLDLINLAAKRHIIPKDGAALYRQIRSNPYVRRHQSPLQRQRMTEMNEAIAFATVHASATCPDVLCRRAVFARSDENKNPFWRCDRHKTPAHATPPVSKISNKDAIAAAKRDM